VMRKERQAINRKNEPKVKGGPRVHSLFEEGQVRTRMRYLQPSTYKPTHRGNGVRYIFVL
jgi:hypothetical protein